MREIRNKQLANVTRSFVSRPCPFNIQNRKAEKKDKAQRSMRLDYAKEREK